MVLSPGDGLLLEKVGYDKYNSIKQDKKSEIMIRLVTQNEEIKTFREGIIEHIARREIDHKAFTQYLSYFDDFCEDYYVRRKKLTEN